jgi:DNA-binding transcriptional ArsR family regulator
VATTTKPEQSRTIEEAVSYALGHRIRIEVLGILNEGPRSPSELARMVKQPLSTVGHHIKELRESRSSDATPASISIGLSSSRSSATRKRASCHLRSNRNMQP